MLGCRALVKLVHHIGQPGLRIGDHEVVGQPGQRLQRLPPLTGRPPGTRRPLGPSCPGDDIADQVTQRLGTVIGSGRAAHQQDRPAHLLAGEEPLAPANEVGDVGVRECGLKGLGLGVGAKEHRNLTCGSAAGDQVLDHLGHTARLGRIIAVCREAGCGAVLSLGAKLEQVASGGAARRAARPMTGAHHEVGQGHDLRGGPVVAHQLDHLRCRVTPGELQQMRGRRAGEGVDRLGRVADHAHVVALTHPQVEQPLL